MADLYCSQFYGCALRYPNEYLRSSALNRDNMRYPAFDVPSPADLQTSQDCYPHSHKDSKRRKAAGDLQIGNVLELRRNTCSGSTMMALPSHVLYTRIVPLG